MKVLFPGKLHFYTKNQSNTAHFREPSPRSQTTTQAKAIQDRKTSLDITPLFLTNTYLTHKMGSIFVTLSYNTPNFWRVKWRSSKLNSLKLDWRFTFLFFLLLLFDFLFYHSSSQFTNMLFVVTLQKNIKSFTISSRERYFFPINFSFGEYGSLSLIGKMRIINVQKLAIMRSMVTEYWA